MKCQLVLVFLSLAVICEANLPGLPFLQRALFKKRSLSKRFTAEEVDEASKEAQKRIKTECYPDAHACSLSCGGHPARCAQCERNMTACVHRVTMEIYAAYNFQYPSFEKKRSALKHVSKALEKAKRHISQADLQSAQNTAMQRAMQECQEPAQESFKKCFSSGKSQDQCASEAEVFAVECSTKISQEEFAKIGIVLPVKHGLKRQISQKDLNNVQNVATQRAMGECQGPAQTFFMDCLISGKSQMECASEVEPMVLDCTNKIIAEEYAKIGIQIPGRRDLKRQISQADLQRIQAVATQRVMQECKQPAQNAFMSCMGKGQSSEHCSLEVESMVVECSTRIAQEEYAKVGISLPSKRSGHKRDVTQADMEKVQKIATSRAMTECTKPIQDLFMNCLTGGNSQAECSKEAEQEAVKCSNEIVIEEYAKIGINLHSMSKRNEINYETQIAISQEIQAKCGEKSEDCFQSCQFIECFDKCQLELSACSSEIYEKYGIEIIDKKSSN